MKHMVIIEGPDIGARSWVYLGRTISGAYCVVGGKLDHPRRCTILGYIVETGLAAGVQPKTKDTINHLVKVRLATPIYTRSRQEYGEYGDKQRDWVVHVSCLSNEKTRKKKKKQL